MYTWRVGIIALTGRAHCQRQVAFFYKFSVTPGNVGMTGHSEMECDDMALMTQELSDSQLRELEEPMFHGQEEMEK